MKKRIFFFLVVALSLVSCTEDMIDEDRELRRPAGLKIKNISASGFDVIWNRVQNATMYIVDVSTDPLFENFVSSFEQVQTTSNRLEVRGVQETSRYYIRVKATDGKDITDYSEVQLATTYFGGEDIEISTDDGLTLKGTLRLHEGVDQQSLIVFCHSAGSSELEWLSHPIMTKLYNEGYGILTFDNRSHGQSDEHPGVPPTAVGELLSNPDGIPLDIVAVYKYILTKDKINHDRLGIIGSSMGANLTCIAMGNTELNFKTAVALSPSAERVNDLSTKISPFELRGIYYIAADGDSDRAFQSLDLNSLTSEPNKISIVQGSDEHGSSIIRNLIGYRGAVYQWMVEEL